jgi:integrase
VQLAITVLKAATAWAFETGQVGRDPLAGYWRPRAISRCATGDAWAADEARRFLAHVATDHLAPARGLERGELAGLRWDAVDLEGATMRIVSTRVLVDEKPVVSNPKTEAGRRNVPLDPVLVGMLPTGKARQKAERLSVGEGWEQSGYVFTDEMGRPLYSEYFSTAFESLAKVAGLREV